MKKQITLSGAGFEMVFVDLDQTLVEKLNRRRAYTVVASGLLEREKKSPGRDLGGSQVFYP
jgi:hypothetical protein